MVRDADHYGRDNCLHYYTINNNEKIVELLVCDSGPVAIDVSKGLSLEKREALIEKVWTPRHSVEILGHLEKVSLLIPAGTNETWVYRKLIQSICTHPISCPMTYDHNMDGFSYHEIAGRQVWVSNRFRSYFFGSDPE